MSVSSRVKPSVKLVTQLSGVSLRKLKHFTQYMKIKLHSFLNWKTSTTLMKCKSIIPLKEHETTDELAQRCEYDLNTLEVVVICGLTGLCC